MSTTIFGVDPGLVDTGVVGLEISPKYRKLTLHYVVHHAKSPETLAEVPGLVAAWIDDHATSSDRVFVESYRERGNSYGTDTKMRQLLREFKLALPQAKVLDNTGVKQVVRPPLLSVLGLNSKRFPTTHHQDLQAAARILVYGMLKDERMNAVLARIVDDHVHQDPWRLL